MSNNAKDYTIIEIDLNPLLEAYLRLMFKTPKKENVIKIHRKHDIGILIHSHILTSDQRTRPNIMVHPVRIQLPVTQNSQHELLNKYLHISIWGMQKIKDGVNYEYRKWINQSFELGYLKKWSQKEIIDTILEGLNMRNNAANFDAIKKIDYRNRKKLSAKRFQELYTTD